MKKKELIKLMEKELDADKDYQMLVVDVRPQERKNKNIFTAWIDVN